MASMRFERSLFNLNLFAFGVGPMAAHWIQKEKKLLFNKLTKFWLLYFFLNVRMYGVHIVRSTQRPSLLFITIYYFAWHYNHLLIHHVVQMTTTKIILCVNVPFSILDKCYSLHSPFQWTLYSAISFRTSNFQTFKFQMILLNLMFNSSYPIENM